LQVPPELSSFAHKKSNPILSLSGNKTSGIPAGKAFVRSLAQQLAMAAAQEDAVRRHRALKALRRAMGSGDGSERGGVVGEGEGDE
jgi:molybdopterin biosynthesis enzyme